MIAPQVRAASGRRRGAGVAGNTGSGTAVFRAANVAQGDGASTLSITKPTGTASGDQLFAFAIGDDAAPTTISNATFTLIDSGTFTGVSGANTWQRTAGASEPTSYTFNWSAAVDIAAGVMAVSGAPTTAIVPVSATGTGTTSMVAPSVNSVASGLLVCVWYIRSDATARVTTAPATMTKRMDASGTWTTLMVATQVISTAGATGTRTATFPVSCNWRALSFVV